MTKVVILDYGLGNLANVARAVLKYTNNVIISGKESEIVSASHLILPGVGAFGDGMKELRERELVDLVLNHAYMGKPLLGICLGMQLLLSNSEEFGYHRGLDIISGSVNKIPSQEGKTVYRKIPHIGWSELEINSDNDNKIFHGINQGDEVYFVHSYMAMLQESNQLISTIHYNGLEIPAIIKKDNTFGMQFHPEKSGQPGLQFISNFLNV